MLEVDRTLAPPLYSIATMSTAVDWVKRGKPYILVPVGGERVKRDKHA